VDDWSLGMSVFVLSVHLRRFGKVSLRLEVVLDLIADGPSRAKVPVVGLDFGRLFEAALWLEVVFQGRHDVGPARWLGLKRPLGLRLVGKRGGSQSKARRTTEVGPGLTSVAEQFHFWGSVVCVSVVGQKSCGSGNVGARLTGHLVVDGVLFLSQEEQFID